MRALCDENAWFSCGDAGALTMRAGWVSVGRRTGGKMFGVTAGRGLGQHGNVASQQARMKTGRVLTRLGVAGERHVRA